MESSGQVSDAEDLASHSPALPSSPLSANDEKVYPFRRRKTLSNAAASRSVSPGRALQSMTSSYSSLESLHTARSGRLLTLHLEKDQSIIWPSLIVGPCPESLAPSLTNSVIFDASHELEHQYNMGEDCNVLCPIPRLTHKPNSRSNIFGIDCAGAVRYS